MWKSTGTTMKRVGYNYYYVSYIWNGLIHTTTMFNLKRILKPILIDNKSVIINDFSVGEFIIVKEDFMQMMGKEKSIKKRNLSIIELHALK